MPQLLFAFFWIVRRGPIGLGILAVAILGLGYYLQTLQNERHAKEAAALAAGPPPAVDVANFDRDLHQTDLREAVIRGQAVFDFAYELTLEKDSGDTEAFMVPLISSTSTNESEVVGIALFHEKGFSFDRLTSEFLMNDLVDFGSVGPIMEYNGKISSLGSWAEMTEEAFWEKDLTFRDDLVVIWPFIDGREVAYAPPTADDMTMFGLLSKIAGVLGLLALGKLVFSSKSEEDATPEPKITQDAPAYDPAPQTTAVPLWKQRSSLVEATDYADEPATFEPANFDETPHMMPQQADPMIAPKRSGFGVRKILIGLVGGLFVLGLVSTVADLIAKSSPAPSVSVTSLEDLTAATVADVIVPDADPNRHWTDIDVTPVIEWFVAKALLAAAGDTDAMMSLGMIIGGLFFAMIMIRYFFLMRRALRPRTTVSVGSMGLN